MSTLIEGQNQMDKAIAHLKQEFSKLRVGRASSAMIDSVKVDAYGSSMSIKELAALSTPDSKTIAIQPWDMSLMAAIEKAILAANLGLTPINDGKIIRINLPPLTEDRRKDYVKKIKSSGEESKVAIRNVRRQILDDIKANDPTEDELKKTQDAIQKVTDKFIKQVDDLVDAKSKELLNL